MKHIVLLFLILTTNLSLGQTEREENKNITNQFIKNYNSDNYNEIFSSFADVMKNALPLNKTKEFLKNLKSQVGNIKSQKFLKYENGTYASYKTNFENAVLLLNISIDNNSKINGLLVKPFVEDIKSNNVINDLTINNNSITKQQAEIIFKNTNVFPNNTQISIALIDKGNISFYGIKKKNDTISNFDNKKSVFEIGSLTKVFTATLLANSVIEEKVGLSDNINSYLNIAFNDDIKISFKDLANHTSGLSRLPINLDFTKVNPNNPYKEYKEKDLEDYLQNQLQISNKGKYQYSNLGAGLLGYTLSKIENDTYENLLQKKIFSKYGMNYSSSDINKVKGKLVPGLDNNGNETPNWEFSSLAGAGAIFSTTEDLSLFANSQFNTSNKELKLTRLKTFEVNENLNLGLGWHILKSQSKNLWYWHNGRTAGYSSSMVIEEDKKKGIIILSNVSGFNTNIKNIDNLCYELMKTLENKK